MCSLCFAPRQPLEVQISSDSDYDMDSSSDEYEYNHEKKKYFSQDFSTTKGNNNIENNTTKQHFVQRSVSAVVSPLTILLDLDNTLVFSSLSEDLPYDFVIETEDESSPGKYETIYVSKRPHLDTFLSKLSKIAKIILFTAARKEYAEQVISIIDPLEKYFSGCYFRDSCTLQPNKSYTKDIGIAGTRPERTILVDDSSDSFGGKFDNAIIIKPYVGNPYDRELDSLLSIITSLNGFDDVRILLRSANCS